MSSPAELEPRVIIYTKPEAEPCIGIQVLGGIAVFNADCDFSLEEQIVASHAMIGTSNLGIVALTGLSLDKTKYRLAHVSQGTPRHGILGKAVGGDEPSMSILQRIDPMYAAFSEREADIVYLIARGLREKEIATRLDISPLTVKEHISRMPDRVCGLRGKELLAAAAVLRDVAHKRLPSNGPKAIPSAADLYAAKELNKKSQVKPVRLASDGNPRAKPGACQRSIIEELEKGPTYWGTLVANLGDKHPYISIYSAVQVLRQKGRIVTDTTRHTINLANTGPQQTANR